MCYKLRYCWKFKSNTAHNSMQKIIQRHGLGWGGVDSFQCCRLGEGQYFALVARNHIRNALYYLHAAVKASCQVLGHLTCGTVAFSMRAPNRCRTDRVAFPRLQKMRDLAE